MMAKNITIGKIGEDVACAHLIKNGYKILERNYREKWDEIDVVARQKDETLVFFEVKTLSSGGDGGLVPEDNMTKSKLAKISKACKLFVAKHPELVNDKKGWQIDLLALTIKDNNYIIKHYENIA